MRMPHGLAAEVQEVAETMEKQGLKEEAIEFYTQVNQLAADAPFPWFLQQRIRFWHLTEERAGHLWCRLASSLLARSRHRSPTSAG